MFLKILLCSRKYCCVLEKIVVFSKILLCFRREIQLCFAPMGHRIPVMHGKTFCKRDKHENQCNFEVHQKLFMSCLRVCSLQEKNSKDSCDGFEEFCIIKKTITSYWDNLKNDRESRRPS